MAEYVNKEEVLERCEALPKLYREAMRLFIKEMPSVNIVRCKECKSYDTEAYQNGYGYCSNHMSVLEDDDFCSRGERSSK